MSFLKSIAKLIFQANGWKIEGKLPPKPHRFVLIIAPHTSDWDVVFALGAAAKVKLEIKLLINKKVFNWIRGPLLRPLGGVPIDKEKNEGVVDKAVELFKENDEFVLAINPEGGKAKCTKLKTGFYYIARQANVPVLMSHFDYKRKVISIGNLFYPSDNIEQDLKFVWDFYKDIPGKFPEMGVSGEMKLPSQKYNVKPVSTEKSILEKVF